MDNPGNRSTCTRPNVGRRPCDGTGGRQPPHEWRRDIRNALRKKLDVRILATIAPRDKFRCVESSCRPTHVRQPQPAGVESGGLSVGEDQNDPVRIVIALAAVAVITVAVYVSKQREVAISDDAPST